MTRAPRRPGVAWVGPLPAGLGELLPGSTSWDQLRSGADRSQVEVLVTTARNGASSEIVDALPGLRAVVSYGAGFDNLDLAQLERRGIAVSTTPDAPAVAVADTALALTLDVMRGVTAADRFVRTGAWHEGPFPLQREVSGARVGIYGLGRIGRAVARRFEGFDCPISYHARHPVPSVPHTYAASLAELADSSDVLVVTAPGGSVTRHSVDDEVLRRLGPRGFLVNVSRGSVVDEQALVCALRARTIAGAGLDVFEDEPHVPEALRGLDNVVITPHIGSATVETRSAMAAAVVSNLTAFLTTGELITPLDLAAL